MEVWAVQALNGLTSGLLLFMLGAGLTLIFSMMGVLNFAHTGFYLLGAYIGWALSGWLGFWYALVLAPLIVGLLGAACQRWLLRAVHRQGHIAELLLTFGVALLIVELVQLIWGRSPQAFVPPAALQGAAFTWVHSAQVGLSLHAGDVAPGLCGPDVRCAIYPATRAFVGAVALLMLVAMAALLRLTRVGLIVRAALEQPAMTEALGHNVPRLMMGVFGFGCALAGLAGVIAAATFTLEPGMAASIGSLLFVVIVVGGLGSLRGAFVGALLVGMLQTLPLAIDATLADAALRLGWQAPAALARVSVAQIAPVLPYALLIAVLLWRPQGLFGRAGT